MSRARQGKAMRGPFGAALAPVAVVIAMCASALTLAPVASADDGARVTELIVAYEPGVRPAESPGVATGSSAVAGVDLAPGQAIGFGLRTVELPASMTTAEAERIAAQLEQSGTVRWAEPSRPTYLADSGSAGPNAVQSGATWGLDRIDQRALPLSGTYGYGGTGAGVTAYIVDTGIRATHVDFGSRVIAGFNVIADANGTDDCHSHGTHVAGTVGGTAYGVAKDVTLVPIRVLDCNGSGSDVGAVQGLNWVVAHHVSGPAVINMSLQVGGISSALDAAVNAAIADGITVVVASGNSTVDACSFSPSHVPGAITVNASTSTDARAYFSNYGACTDLYAPGYSITSDTIASDTSTGVKSGTSMASPHVAGAAARLLGQSPGLTPAQVWSILDAATTTVAGLAFNGLDTTKLLYLPAVAAPTAPLSVAATTGDASAAVMWAAPASDGGSAVTGFTARAFAAGTGGSPVATCSTALLTCTIAGLTNATEYFVDVVATNAAGTGDASAPRAAVTPAVVMSVPGAPTTVSRTVAGSTVSVTWAPPVSDGGSAILSYQGLAFDSPSAGAIVRSCTVAAPSTTCTITGLSIGSTYHVAARAKNAVGWGAGSARIESVTTASTPTAPTAVSRTPGNAQLSVGWSAPLSDGGSPLAQYQGLAWNAAVDGAIVRSCTVIPPATGCVITGLVNGTTYYVNARAKNASGWGAQSSRVAAVPAPVAPSVPRSVTREIGNGSVTVSWIAPVSEGGTPITSYQALAYDLASGGAILRSCSTSGALTCTITGLANGTAYYIAVRAKNAAGWSVQSARIEATPAGAVVTAPGTPTGVQVTPAPGLVAVSWTPPASDGGSPILSYQALAWDQETGGAITRTCTIAPPGVDCTISGLVDGTTYYVAVRAKSAAGWGVESARVAATSPASTGGLGALAPTPDSPTVR